MSARRRSKTAVLREQAMLAAILSQPTLTRAAAAVGLNERTLRRAMKRPGFAKRVAEARKQAVELAIGSLASLAGEAHDALRRNLGGGVPAVEVRAATAVYGGILKGHEQLVAAKELDEVQRQLLELQAAQQQASEGKAHDQ